MTLRHPSSIIARAAAVLLLAAALPPRSGADGIDYAKGKQFWSFLPVRKPAVPEVRQPWWPRNDIDRFVLRSLENENLPLAPDADPRVLIRRLYYDLTGLPPSPTEADAFVSSWDTIDTASGRIGESMGSQDAGSPPRQRLLERTVDRLLARPEFGERWGRHWLDVIRFAESSGGGRALLFPDAWRVRDYVIASFNRDKPFDAFIREHIAGDLLPWESGAQRREQLIATGFLALGPTNYENQDKEVLDMEVIDEQLDTVGRAFLGMTLGCARCHDHKFDPISIEDYYALAGIFKNTRTTEHANVSGWISRWLPFADESRQRTEDEGARIEEFHTEVARFRAEIAATTTAEERKNVQGKLQSYLNKWESVYERAMGVEEAEKIADMHVCIRGDVHNPGDTVPRSVLPVALTGESPPMPAGQSGRLQLADWIASPGNPLTARVLVNRFWHHLFGKGLVATVDNFGATGELPSHPELLDWLAHTFVEQDSWSAKKMIRRIVLSRAYGMASFAGPGDSAEFGGNRPELIDPENRLLWRRDRRRLQAESIRDGMLFVSGELQSFAGGPTVPDKLKSEFDYRETLLIRSVYLPVFRNVLDEAFEVFDFANPNLATGARAASTIAPQALYLMNNSFVIDRAEAAARRLLDLEPTDESARIRLAYRSTLGRLPTPAEEQLAAAFLASYSEPDSDPARAWTAFQQSLFASLDFRYVE